MYVCALRVSLAVSSSQPLVCDRSGLAWEGELGESYIVLAIFFHKVVYQAVVLMLIHSIKCCSCELPNTLPHIHSLFCCKFLSLESQHLIRIRATSVLEDWRIRCIHKSLKKWAHRVFTAMVNVFLLQKVLLFFSPFPGDLICPVSHKAVSRMKRHEMT